MGGRVELGRTPLLVGAGATLFAAAALPLLPTYHGVICPLRVTTGLPCPLCGMTTSLTAVGRGRLVEAAAANPAGLAVVAIAAAVVFVRPSRLSVPVWSLVSAALAMWTFELFRFSVL